MKIMIIADSLSCPREDISAEETWVYKLMQNKVNDIFYTDCFFGKNSDDVIKTGCPMIGFVKPNLVIIQIGIVDCCKRVCSRKMLDFIKKIPYIRGLFHRYVKKNHYRLTKKSKHYIVDKENFSLNILKITEQSKLNNGKVIFLSIADAGDKLTSSIYNIENDIVIYNNIIKNKCDNINSFFLNPYVDEDKEKYLIKEDGHHLNPYGHELVYSRINCFINSMVSKI